MPSFYTEKIGKGITFQKFAMCCARAMGACIIMRDEPANAEIPKSFKPSTYNAKQLRKAQKHLATVSAMPLSACAAAAGEAYEKAKSFRDKEISERSELKLKYERMLSEVNAWNPPTADHVGMKEFMTEQIVQAINFDCDTSYFGECPPLRMSAKNWKAAEIAAAAKDIVYHQKAQDEEVERTNKRNAWLKELRKSLS